MSRRMTKPDSEAVYYQDALTDAVGDPIKHDFVHFNWQWLNERKKRYNWGQLTSNLFFNSSANFENIHSLFCISSRNPELGITWRENGCDWYLN